MKVFNRLRSILSSKPIYPEHNAEFTETYAEFKNLYPEYTKSHSLSELRENEFSRLDDELHTFLDFATQALYAPSQLQAYHELLNNHLIGSPQTKEPASDYTQQLVKQSKQHLLKYCNTNEQEYICIFTPHIQDSLKLITDNYPFEQNAHLLMSFDYQKALGNLHQEALKKGASFNFSEMNLIDFRINERKMISHLDTPTNTHKLFAYPAQSSLTGVEHGLEWINIGQSKGWDVLLDATHYLSSNQLDLQTYPADIVTISFRHIFGFPAYMNALLINRKLTSKLKIKVEEKVFFKTPSYSEKERLNFLELPAIHLGIDWVRHLGHAPIQSRIKSLTNWLLDTLQILRHDNGKKLIQLYGPKNTIKRGGIIALNFLDPGGQVVPSQKVNQLAHRYQISILTDIEENPGINTLIAQNQYKHLSHFLEYTNRKPFHIEPFVVPNLGIIRISLGYISNFQDVHRFILFCQKFLNKSFDHNMKETITEQTHKE